MNRTLTILFLAATVSGCGLLDSDDEPPPPDPALAPPSVEPTPVTPTPTEPTAADTPTQPGSLQIPGLEGFPIPLPTPAANRPPAEPPARGSLAAAPTGTYDASGHMTREFLEQRTTMLHRTLVDRLDAHENSQVRDIPFRIVREPNQPNAAAGCTNGREAVMMITTAMLELCAGIAEAKAYDEVAGTETYETYVTRVVSQVRGGQTITGVDAGAHSAPHSTDSHKLSRQIHLFDQQVAFILGHELAHHYRGHTSCVGGRSQAEIQRDELSRMLAHTIPPFSQPREVEADMWGLVSVLEAGHERAGGTWTEEGALLNLDFFRRLSDRGGQELILAFLSTHPPSIVRIPIVESTAQQWTHGWRPPRMPVPGQTGGTGQGIELPGPGGPIRLPGIDPSQLPIPIPFPLGGRGGSEQPAQ